MSECRFWWRAGDVEWCDMIGEACRCGGWDERCDMKLKDKQGAKAPLAAQVQSAMTEEND